MNNSFKKQKSQFSNDSTKKVSSENEFYTKLEPIFRLISFISAIFEDPKKVIDHREYNLSEDFRSKEVLLAMQQILEDAQAKKTKAIYVGEEWNTLIANSSTVKASYGLERCLHYIMCTAPNKVSKADLARYSEIYNVKKAASESTPSAKKTKTSVDLKCYSTKKKTSLSIHPLSKTPLNFEPVLLQSTSPSLKSKKASSERVEKVFNTTQALPFKPALASSDVPEAQNQLYAHSLQTQTMATATLSEGAPSLSARLLEKEASPFQLKHTSAQLQLDEPASLSDDLLNDLTQKALATSRKRSLSASNSSVSKPLQEASHESAAKPPIVKIKKEKRETSAHLEKVKILGQRLKKVNKRSSEARQKKHDIHALFKNIDKLEAEKEAYILEIEAKKEECIRKIEDAKAAYDEAQRILQQEKILYEEYKKALEGSSSSSADEGIYMVSDDEYKVDVESACAKLFKQK